MKCFNINARPADIYRETLHMVLVCILMVSIMTWRQLPKSYHRWCALFWKLSYSDLKWTIGAWMILSFNCKTERKMQLCMIVCAFIPFMSVVKLVEANLVLWQTKYGMIIIWNLWCKSSSSNLFSWDS